MLCWSFCRKQSHLGGQCWWDLHQFEVFVAEKFLSCLKLFRPRYQLSRWLTHLVHDLDLGWSFQKRFCPHHCLLSANRCPHDLSLYLTDSPSWLKFQLSEDKWSFLLEPNSVFLSCSILESINSQISHSTNTVHCQQLCPKGDRTLSSTQQAFCFFFVVIRPCSVKCPYLYTVQAIA